MHLGQGNPKCPEGLGGRWIENSHDKKDLEVFMDRKVSLVRQYGLAAQKKLHPELHQKQHSQQSPREVILLCHSQEALSTLPGVLCPSLRPMLIKTWSKFRGGPQG